MKNFTGFLIKQQRLRQGLSQEALCKGICAVSYLSKIAQGLSRPSPAILRELIMTLGISYNQDEEMLREAQDMLEAYFDKYFHSETAEKESSWLNAHRQEIENSELHLSWHLYHLYALLQKYGKKAPLCHQESAYLARFLDYMEEDQLFYYYAGAGQVESEDQLELLRKAETYYATSFVKQSIAETHYARKEYMEAIAAAERAFSAAAEEGNLPILLWSSYLLGACYAGFNDLGFMQRYYKRARELAICYFEQGQDSLGLEYLRSAADLRVPRMPAIYDKLLTMTNLRYVQGDIHSPKYEDVLKELYESDEPSLGEGYRRLFSSYLVQLYTAQRKYKDALAVQAEHAYLG